MCSLWYANYTSVKLTEKVKKKKKRHTHKKNWTRQTPIPDKMADKIPDHSSKESSFTLHP